MLESLMTNPYAWLALSVISVVSAVFGIWTWFAGKQRKEISIYCKSDEIIKAGKQRIQKLNVMFDGRAIDDLTSTKFYIWNSGNQVLYNADIVTSKPLKIHTEKATILDVQILRVSDDTNVFEITSASDKEVTLAFDYVEKGDGVLVQVLHTGNPLDLTLGCKIKGGLEVRDCTVNNKNRHISRRDRLVEFLADMIPGLGAILSFFGPPYILAAIDVPVSDEPINPATGIIAVIFILVIYFAFVAICVKLCIRLGEALKRRFNLSVPSSLLVNSNNKE